MAIKGQSYTKTSWAFEERPVASSKLNLWDDRMEAAMELVHFLLNYAWGGGNGVIRGATTDDLKTVALTTPGLSVKVKPGYAFIGKYPYKLATITQTADVTPPSSLPRVDLVQARLGTWDVGIKTGQEAASPTPPTPDTDCIALGELHLRVGMTCIKDTDDGTNGYIVDARAFL
jgi:hypothetical protein